MSYFQGLYSLSGKTSYRKISWSLEAARFGFKLFQSLWNLVGTSAALLPRCLSNFRAIRPLQHPISRLRDFTGFGGKTSYRLVNRGPVSGTDLNGRGGWGESHNLTRVIKHVHPLIHGSSFSNVSGGFLGVMKRINRGKISIELCGFLLAKVLVCCLYFIWFRFEIWNFVWCVSPVFENTNQIQWCTEWTVCSWFTRSQYFYLRWSVRFITSQGALNCNCES